MRVLVAWILALGLVASPAMAKAGGTSDDTVAKANSDNDAAAKSKTDETATTSKTDSATSATTPAKTESPALEAEFQQLRDLLESQAAQLKAQSEQLKQQQQKMEALEKQLNASSSAAAGPAGVVASTESSSSAPSAPSSGIITVSVPSTGIHTTSPSAPAQDMNKGDEPMALHFKGITLTPSGFMAAETVWRSKALSADVNTPFNSAPMPGASNSNLSEFNASGRQSRIGMLFEGKLSDVKIGGYYEGDFLGGGSTSNDNQSNSYVFRQRQFWAQAAFNNGFKVTGGQMWSLVTETTKGMDNRTEALPNTIDAQYTVGFSWARQYGLRFTKDWGDKFWLGFAVEEAQTTFTVHGNPTQSVTTGATTVLVPCVGAAVPPCTATVGGTTTVYTNFLLGATGASGGLYNPLANYSYNPGPDLVFKAVAEPGWGHYEVFGVVSQFRDRVFPCEVGISATTPCPIDGSTVASAVGAYNDSRTGGGGGANARWNLFEKHVDLGFHIFGGSGIGRYGSGGLSDATIRPDGTIALLRNYQSLGTLQFHITPKFDLNLNGGGEYSSRAAYTTLAGKPEGYGNPLLSNAGCYTEILPNTTVPAGTTGSQGYIPGSLANCTSDTRALLEGSLGFWYRFYKGPKGTLQFGSQYSYYVRHTWEGVAPSGTTPAGNPVPGLGVGSPHSVENMWFTSFRYYLP